MRIIGGRAAGVCAQQRRVIGRGRRARRGRDAAAAARSRNRRSVIRRLRRSASAGSAARATARRAAARWSDRHLHRGDHGPVRRDRHDDGSLNVARHRRHRRHRAAGARIGRRNRSVAGHRHRSIHRAVAGLRHVIDLCRHRRSGGVDRRFARHGGLRMQPPASADLCGRRKRKGHRGERRDESSCVFGHNLTPEKTNSANTISLDCGRERLSTNFAPTSTFGRRFVLLGLCRLGKPCSRRT